MKINLLHKISIRHRRAQMIQRINLIALVTTGVLFAGSVILVSTRFIYLQIRASGLNQSIKTLSANYSVRVNEIAQYVRIKENVSAFKTISSQRFRYKDFLQGIYRLLPAGGSVVSVDFALQGVITVIVRFDSITGYETFLTKLNQESQSPNYIFKAVAEKLLTRDPVGRYQANLEIKI